MVGTTKVILAKKEVVYGTDPVPTAALNAVATRNFRCTPLEVDQLDRNLDIPSRGRTTSAPTNRRSTRSFEVEIAGSGTAGTAAAWMELHEACGMEPPVLAVGVDATLRYAVSGVDGSSVTFYDAHANQRRRGLGSRGTFGWNFTAGAYPFWNYSFTSLVPANEVVAAAAMGAPVFTRWKDPVEVNVDNTRITLGGLVVSCRTFTGETGAEVGLRNLTGERYIGRGNHAITGTLSVACPDLATKNYWTNLDKGDLLTFLVEHGVTPGNIVTMQSANLQILSIAVVEENERLLIDIGYGLNVVAGQDDLLIKSK